MELSRRQFFAIGALIPSYHPRFAPIDQLVPSPLMDPITAQLATGSALDLGPLSPVATVFGDLGSVSGGVQGAFDLGTAP
jgi:hypothetical protein